MTRRAFSIIELVVVIGIITILIGLVLPAFSHARSSADGVSLAAEMQQLARINDLYCDDWDGFYAVADDRPDFAPPDLSIEDAVAIGLGRRWETALVGAGLIDQRSITRWFSDRTIYPSVAMYIDPRQMTPTTIQPWETLETSAVARAWATYPSDKLLFGVSFVSVGGRSVLWNQFGADGPLGPVVAADGSVFMMMATELLQPKPAPILDYGIPIQYTWNGIRGRDK